VAQIAHLEAFTRLLRTRAVEAGWIGSNDRHRVWERHVLDSLRALACLPPGPTDAADIGSGAGLPGIPVAIARPDLRIYLIEPKLRKVAFLEFAVEQLELANVTVLPQAARSVTRQVKVATARALAGPAEAWAIGGTLLEPEGQLIYFAGRSWSERDAQALRAVGVSCAICSRPRFAWHGPLVIMGRSTA